jgi:hemerythrin-like domain-containing protein
MAEDISPIKRSVQLAPLSREHHEGLLFAWKIHQGLKNNTSLQDLRNYVMWYWRNHIKPHFYQEENILRPYFPEESALVERMQEDHEFIREIILGLDDQVDRRTLVLLADMINKHIRFEERHLFAYLEEYLSPQQLDEIFRDLEKKPVQCDCEWENEFWVKKT